MYLLTLQFDFPKESKGRFEGDAKVLPGVLKDPLSTSLNWIMLDTVGPPAIPEPDFPLPPGFNVEPLTWIDLGEATTLHIPTPDPQVIGVYVRQDTDDITIPVLDEHATASLSVCFGRPTKANQAQASPITDNGKENGNVITTFIFPPEVRNSPPPPGVPAGKLGWFFPLGKISHRPPSKNKRKLHRYEFAIGLVVTDVTRGITRYYGEDPEMDIGEY